MKGPWIPRASKREKGYSTRCLTGFVESESDESTYEASDTLLVNGIKCFLIQGIPKSPMDVVTSSSIILYVFKQWHVTNESKNL